MIDQETAARLAEIREREQQATAGPWVAVGSELTVSRNAPYAKEALSAGRVPVRVDEPKGEVTFALGFVEDVVSADGTHVYCGGHDYDDRGSIGVEDAEFMAHARQDVPYLLDLVASLEQRATTSQREAQRLRSALTDLVAAVERDDNPSAEGHFSDSDEMRQARAALASPPRDPEGQTP